MQPQVETGGIPPGPCDRLYDHSHHAVSCDQGGPMKEGFPQSNNFKNGRFLTSLQFYNQLGSKFSLGAEAEGFHLESVLLFAITESSTRGRLSQVDSVRVWNSVLVATSAQERRQHSSQDGEEKDSGDGAD